MAAPASAPRPPYASTSGPLVPDSHAQHAAAVIAEVTRRDVRTGRELIESTHRGHVVVVAPDGTVATSVGDADRVTFVRSAVKPFQATACLEILDEHGDAGGLTTADLAIGQASHRAEPRHLDAVRALLDRSGTDPDELSTPPGRAEAQPQLGEARIHYNCSGKHALFALAGAALGCPRERLLDPDGPLQQPILAVLEDALGPPAAIGTDGCGSPAVAVPIVRLAEAFQRLRTEARWSRARDAALQEPALVGGAGRLDSALLAVGISAKAGAEGVYGASWTDDGGDSWGAAVKCEDGDRRGADAALLGLLSTAGIVPADVHEIPPPTGGGRPAGLVRPGAAVLDAARTLGRSSRVRGAP